MPVDKVDVFASSCVHYYGLTSLAVFGLLLRSVHTVVTLRPGGIESPLIGYRSWQATFTSSAVHYCSGLGYIEAH